MIRIKQISKFFEVINLALNKKVAYVCSIEILNAPDKILKNYLKILFVHIDDLGCITDIGIPINRETDSIDIFKYVWDYSKQFGNEDVIQNKLKIFFNREIEINYEDSLWLHLLKEKIKL